MELVGKSVTSFTLLYIHGEKFIILIRVTFGLFYKYHYEILTISIFVIPVFIMGILFIF